MATATALPKRRLRAKAPPGNMTAKVLAPCGGPAEPSTWVIKERHDEFIVVGSLLDPALLERTLQYLKRKRPQPAKMKNEGGESDDERKARYDDRDSNVSWFDAKVDCPGLHQRIVQIMSEVANAQWSLFPAHPHGAMNAGYEEVQYAVYGPKQHFQAWHHDAYVDGHDPEDSRQFAVVIMLAARDAYSGGSFQAKVKNSSGKRVVRSLKMDIGDAVVFPAKHLEHRVSVVRSGLRKTLVSWAYDAESCLCKQAPGTHETAKRRRQESWGVGEVSAVGASIAS